MQVGAEKGATVDRGHRRATRHQPNRLPMKGGVEEDCDLSKYGLLR